MGRDRANWNRDGRPVSADIPAEAADTGKIVVMTVVVEWFIVRGSNPLEWPLTRRRTR